MFFTHLENFLPFTRNLRLSSANSFSLEESKINYLQKGKGLRYIRPCLYQPFPKQQVLDLSKLKEYADDNFKFDENDRKFSKWVENTVEKGKIAHYEQFLLFSQCFQWTCTADM